MDHRAAPKSAIDTKSCDFVPQNLLETPARAEMALTKMHFCYHKNISRCVQFGIFREKSSELVTFSTAYEKCTHTLNTRLKASGRVRKLILTVALLANTWGAMAAQQCLTTSGQYGSLTVSSCASDPANGIYNPLPPESVPPGYPMADGSGFALGNVFGLLSCTFTLSHPVLTSSVRIEADIFNPNQSEAPALLGDQLFVELNGNPYQFIASDIVQTPLGGAFLGTDSVAANANGSIVNAPGTTYSSGVMQLANNAPANFSTIKVSMQANGSGTPIRLCLDDAAPATAPVAVAVPATSSHTLALLSLGVLLLGVFLSRQRAFKQ